MNDDIEVACVNLEADWPYGNMPESLRTVIAAAREKEVAEGMTLAVHLAVKGLREQLAAERNALQADIERHVEIASREAEARFQAEARAERLETALRKYGEHYEGCHGGHRCHCGLSAALGDKS